MLRDVKEEIWSVVIILFLVGAVTALVYAVLH